MTKAQNCMSLHEQQGKNEIDTKLTSLRFLLENGMAAMLKCTSQHGGLPRHRSDVISDKKGRFVLLFIIGIDSIWAV